ncbi:MAG: phage portal protein [Dehalococcoidia bacterium]
MNDFTPSQLARMDTDRLATYRTNLDFYNGSQWQTTSRNRQLVFNYAKASIDKITSFLMQGLGFACYPGEETDELKARVRKAEQLLRQVYEQNNLQQLDWETEVDAAVLGDGCYKVIWDTDKKRIRITAPDVSGIFAWWLGDDTSRVWRVASRYTLTQDETQLLYPHYASRITKKTATITELWTAKDFQLYLDNDLIESKPNPYGFIPFIIFPNLREPKKFWGISDVPLLIQPQRELNRAMSQLSRILELSGNPIAVLENIGSAEDIKVQPGAVWTIPEDAKAYLLDLLQGGGIRLHIDYIDLIYRTLQDISETPQAAWGGTEKDISGTALNIELGSLVQKVTRKRTIRTNAYHQRNAMILRLAERYMQQNSTGISHRVIWGNILPQDIARQAQNEQLLVQAGVHSRRTAMDELGIQDPDEEFTRWLEERQKILEMNQEFKASSTRGGARARATAAEMEVPE